MDGGYFNICKDIYLHFLRSKKIEGFNKLFNFYSYYKIPGKCRKANFVPTLLFVRAYRGLRRAGRICYLLKSLYKKVIS